MRPESVHRRSDGKRVFTKMHICKFRGRNNAIKSKVLLCLYREWSISADSDGLALPQLLKLIGCSGRDSLRVLLRHYCQWEYIKRVPKVYAGSLCFGYRIDVRGRKFIERRLPESKRLQFIEEMKAARVKQNNDSENKF